jgi:hypothetical protein
LIRTRNRGLLAISSLLLVCVFSIIVVIIIDPAAVPAVGVGSSISISDFPAFTKVVSLDRFRDVILKELYCLIFFDLDIGLLLVGGLAWTCF